MHPMSVHFPIAQLMTVPIFIILGMIFLKKGKWFFISAWLLMVLGVISTFVSVDTGKDAAMAVYSSLSANVQDVLKQHAMWAKRVRLAFTILAVVYAAILFVTMILKKEMSLKLSLIIQAVFLVVYLACIGLIAQTGKLGGMLVHEYGVRAVMEAPGNSAKTPQNEKTPALSNTNVK
jgi:uncharacterized membrane protein